MDDHRKTVEKSWRIMDDHMKIMETHPKKGSFDAGFDLEMDRKTDIHFVVANPSPSFLTKAVSSTFCRSHHNQIPQILV